MVKFYLWAGDEHQPKRGATCLRGSFASVDEAEAAAKLGRLEWDCSRTQYDWWHVAELRGVDLAIVSASYVFPLR